MTNDQIAQRIVKRLFVNGSAEQADRLVLVRGTRDLGGWGRGPVRDVIIDVLREAQRKEKT